eukprot:CAMPEP_0201120858 /NCGR_PEP_ID=MMETSP0850-20130426/4856_1 /ASSEMBLY_ACC=CAM_ASM_000622 /TAXON_ID=183588 /ORGANISM="Pseudo-nitzschia fraudulenta, Strain WWA7" /LENGTH=102 /DNA_ID=CAMNT_0047387137 /DNA_START=205 /DNA_END=513 /DNA_ORIENTATION=+
MVKKKSNTRRRRKKSNTTINEGERQHQGAKRQKTEATGVSDAKNRLVSAIKAMIDSMNEEHLYSVMVYAGTVGKELLMGSDKAAADTSAAKAIEASTATAKM